MGGWVSAGAPSVGRRGEESRGEGGGGGGGASETVTNKIGGWMGCSCIHPYTQIFHLHPPTHPPNP